MNEMYIFTADAGRNQGRRLCRVLLLSALLSLNGCMVAAAAGAAVGATVEIVKIPFRVVGAAVDLVIPGGD